VLLRKWVPYIQAQRCKACGVCGPVCAHACLDVVEGVGVLARPEDCSSEGDCVDACPEGAIRMRWMPVEGHSSIGRWRTPRARACLQQ
jgi:MinD superfamily P-loop ATPase